MLRLILRVQIQFLKNRKILKEAFGVVSTGGRGRSCFVYFRKVFLAVQLFRVANLKIEKFRQN